MSSFTKFIFILACLAVMIKNNGPANGQGVLQFCNTSCYIFEDRSRTWCPDGCQCVLTNKKKPTGHGNCWYLPSG
uniref:Putative short evasin n=1 Tax=Rhipicephalus microplus TaxID=6941 RepID=A0A6G5A642_RHIMP